MTGFSFLAPRGLQGYGNELAEIGGRSARPVKSGLKERDRDNDAGKFGGAGGRSKMQGDLWWFSVLIFWGAICVYML